MTTPDNGIPPGRAPSGPIAERFRGKVAFVTGAARGQGRAEALRLAAEGADVIAVDICRSFATTQYAGATPEDLAETVSLVEKLDRRILARQVDTRDFAALEAVVQEGVAEFGGLDVVVANAGITSAEFTWKVSAEAWDESVGVNLTGAFYTAKAAIPVMIEQGRGGAIVFTSSVAGLRGLPLLAPYVAAKHGVVGLAKTLANELAEYRIRVNTVIPHAVATDLSVPELFPMLEGRDHLARMFEGALPDFASTPEDIAAAVAWLASDEARHVTGIQLPVDLGRINR